MIDAEKVTLTLPKRLMDEVRAIAPSRGQSKFIAEAIEFLIESRRRQALRERLIAGYQANAAADTEMAAGWAAVEDEAWLTHILAYPEEQLSNDTSTNTTR